MEKNSIQGFSRNYIYITNIQSYINILNKKYT